MLRSLILVFLPRKRRERQLVMDLWTFVSIYHLYCPQIDVSKKISILDFRNFAFCLRTSFQSTQMPTLERLLRNWHGMLFEAILKEPFLKRMNTWNRMNFVNSRANPKNPSPTQ